MFVFRNFNVHHKDWLTFSGGTDRSGELWYNFSTSNDLTWIVNFPTRISYSQTVINAVLLCWIYFFLLKLLFVQQWFSLHWEILIILLSQFPLTFQHIHNRMPCFIALLMTILVLIGMVFVIIWEMFHGGISLSLVLLFLLVNFWVGSGWNSYIYIPHRKYQVKSHSSSSFLAAYAAVIVHRNHFFCLYQKDKSSAASKVKFR